MTDRLLHLYRIAILRLPWLPLLTVFGVVAFFASFLPQFKLDVSSDGLILEDDPALRVYDASRLIFGSDDYVIIAFRADDVFSEDNIRLISSLTQDLSKVRGVDRVMSLTSERLFCSPKTGTLLGLLMGGGEPLTLDSPKCDRALARKELTESGVYANNLVTPDGTRTALLVYLLQKSEGHLLEKRIHEIDETLAKGEGDRAALKAERKEVRKAFQFIVDERRDRREQVLKGIREVLAKYQQTGRKFYSSGLPLIFVDMMAYVRRDMVLFGSLVGALLILVLGIVFRRARWVVLPMAAGLTTVCIVVGAMVAAGIRTTVITSNLTSLLMILTMAHSIHFAVRYQEERALDPTASRRDRTLRTVRHIGIPCFYIATTTAVGFLSLLISGIRPVIEFGQFMAFGVMLAFFLTFLLLPAGLMLWPGREKHIPAPPSEKGPFQPLAALTARHRWLFLFSGVALTVFSAIGITRLDVETIFIDYFQKNTEIHRGLRFIDQELGGTSSLEVLLTAEEDDYFSSWEHLEPVRKIENYLNSVPEVGKVLSVVTLMQEIDRVLVAYGNPHPKGKDRHGAKTLLLPLAAMGSEAIGPDQAPLYAYMDPSGRKTRIFVRLRETAESLNRNRVVRELEAFLRREANVPGVKVEVTGVFVLYGRRHGHDDDPLPLRPPRAPGTHPQCGPHRLRPGDHGMAGRQSRHEQHHGRQCEPGHRRGRHPALPVPLPRRDSKGRRL
jgi:predicted RND superfamily exporter protein